MQAWLEHDDLWECVTSPNESNSGKVTKAKSRIILSVDPVNYAYIQDCTTAKKVWERLQVTFEDFGLTRRVGLLRTLVTTQLEKCKNVEEYVNVIMTTAHKLDGVGFKVPDVWIGTLLLAGLPDMYRPMIMGLENSGMDITADLVKTKLLQEVKNCKGAKNGNSDAAFYSKKEKGKAKAKSKSTVLSM
ncbi:hypothetical protein X777_07416 [Ooceraea biroi]|uniref:Copia protein n=1 Tax=Ooceraea biroi TaxID=2015173 RepID=A0A026WDM9_OOCBI|nr:hypothetical protein X777_07416 [Ooceraea biroi]